MTKPDPKRAESVFDDFKSAYTPLEAKVEADRCFFCFDAPCITACPTGIDIPQFIRKISTGNIRGSAETIFDANVFGMSCSRTCPVEVLCVGACVYNETDQPPIQIGRLQRYATDIAYDEGWQFFEAGPPTGKKIALIGAGPASLACAHRLRRLGHDTIIYEKSPIAGGLASTGIAPYKIKLDRALEEVDWIREIGGIEIRPGELGKDLQLEALEAEFDAVFLGFGLGQDRRLGLDIEDGRGIYHAVTLVELIKTQRLDLSAKHAVVIGGGNTAIDIVRQLLGLGIEKVSLAYRGNEATMSGYVHEWQVAKTEGARAIWQVQPTEFILRDHQLSEVKLVALDDDKRPMEGSERIIFADLAVIAIGQNKAWQEIRDHAGLRITQGRLEVDANGFTGRAKVFAGGDLVNGGREVVHAVASGRDAATGIHRFLMGGDS